MKNRISGIAAPQALSSDGFPVEMEYVLRMEGKQEVSLHLVRNKLTESPATYKQNDDGTFETIKQKNKKVRCRLKSAL